MKAISRNLLSPLTEHNQTGTGDAGRGCLAVIFTSPVGKVPNSNVKSRGLKAKSISLKVLEFNKKKLILGTLITFKGHMAFRDKTTYASVFDYRSLCI